MPAVGKSTVASALNEAGRFAYVRIDSIEQAIRASGEVGPHGIQVAGYTVGYSVCGDLLDGGMCTVSHKSVGVLRQYIIMASGSYEPYDAALCIKSIHQQPITFDMKFAILGEPALKFMIAVVRSNHPGVIFFQGC